MTANVPEYSEGSVTDDDTEGSKRQFSAVADTISDAWARLVVNPVMNAWRMATGIDTPGLYLYLYFNICNSTDYTRYKLISSWVLS